MRRYIHRRVGRGRHRIKRIHRVFLLLFLMLPTMIWAEKRLPNLPPEVRETALRGFAQEKISDTVSDFLEDTPVLSGDTLLTIDTYRLRKAQTALTAQLQKRLTGRAVLWVPLGSLTDIALLNGRGPKIPVILSTVCAADLAFESAMASAGINRTQVRISLRITAEVSSLSVTFPGTISVAVSYPVYESVHEGAVPQIASVLK